MRKGNWQRRVEDLGFVFMFIGIIAVTVGLLDQVTPLEMGLCFGDCAGLAAPDTTPPSSQARGD